MDALLGSYNHPPRERRYFGAIYLLLRIAHVTAFTLLTPSSYFAVGSYIMIATAFTVAIFRPYKNKWHNIVDILLFSLAAHGYLMVVFQEEGLILDPQNGYDLIHSYSISGNLSITVVSLYGFFVLIKKLSPWRMIKEIANSLWQKICCFKMSTRLNELPHNIERDYMM